MSTHGGGQAAEARQVRKRRRRSKATPQNSHTSPRKIAMQRKRAQALALRERGLSFPAIAKEMKVSTSNAHELVVVALKQITLESAKEVLRLELQRLDAYLATYHEAALRGDHEATKMCLRVIDRRARLLGLYPETGKPAQLLAQITAPGGERTPIAIEFVLPTAKREVPADVPDHGPYPWQKRLAPPARLRKGRAW